MEWSERSMKLWDKQIEFWDAKDEIWKNGPRAEMLQFLYRINDSSDSKVLDLGCGPGESTRLMQEHGYDVVGIDQSSEMVSAAKRRGVKAMQSQCDPLPFSDESFDCVFACTSMEWSDEPHKIIKEVHRVLKPGGKFVAVTLGAFAGPRQSGYERLYGKPVIHNMMMPWELHQLLEEHNFNVIDMRGAYGPSIGEDVVNHLKDNWVAKSALSFLWAFAVEKQ